MTYNVQLKHYVVINQFKNVVFLKLTQNRTWTVLFFMLKIAENGLYYKKDRLFSEPT